MRQIEMIRDASEDVQLALMQMGFKVRSQLNAVDGLIVFEHWVQAQQATTRIGQSGTR